MSPGPKERRSTWFQVKWNTWLNNNEYFLNTEYTEIVINAN